MRFPYSNPLPFSPAGMGSAARVATVVFSWQSLGIVLFAVMLARWVWIFAAPPEMAMPATTSWQKSDVSEDLFGRAADTNASAVIAGNIKLIGLFAHKTAGFAVLQIDGKQVGGGLGAEVAPGLRLVETNADHVLLERGGIRQRLDLQASGTVAGISPAPSAAVMTTAPDRETLPSNMNLDTIPPAQRAAMQQELDNLRRAH